MTHQRFSHPAPRPAVADPALWRPDQYSGNLRPENVLWLDRGECIDPELTELAFGLLRDIPVHAVFAYPTPGPLYRKLARLLGMEPDRLCLTRGMDGSIKTVYETFLEPDDVVLVTDPTYQMYGVYAQIFGVRLAKVPYRMVDGRPVLTGAEMIEGIRRHRPKLIGLPHPDNPTGFVFSEAEMRSVVETAGEVGALILIDEAYHPFHPHTCLPWIDEYGHLVVARSFSKAWGMAGIRLGYTVAAPEVTALLHKVRTMVEADGLAMTMAERMLDHRPAMEASLERLIRGRRHFAEEMQALGFHAIETPCNFVHVDFARKRDAAIAALDGVARYRVFPDSILKHFLRFTTTTPEMFEPVVAAIRRIV